MGQQGRGQRIARMAGVDLAVKGEGQGSAAVNQPAMAQAKGLAAHAAVPRAMVAPMISYVRVSR
jgi:hypothetical protein